jgi:hypothetical protein
MDGLAATVLGPVQIVASVRRKAAEQIATIGTTACWMIPLAIVEWRLRAERTAAVR